MSSDFLEGFTENLLIEAAQSSEVLVGQQDQLVLLEVAQQGPPGPKGDVGDRGPIGDANGALLVTNQLAELASPQAQIQAQSNLGLGLIDPLAYYILAKS